MAEIVLKRKKVLLEKLVPYGFAKKKEGFYYTKRISQGQFLLSVLVKHDGRMETTLTDTALGEEYILHLVPGTTGAFVGQVRQEYQEVLDHIFENCYEPDVFQSEYAHKLISYVRDTYGDELEFLWKKFPDNAVWRRKDTNKWYAALLTVEKSKLGIEGDGWIEIIDIKANPDEIEALVDHKKYYPGWHMNKKNWISICLDGSVGFDELCHRIADSYHLAHK